MANKKASGAPKKPRANVGRAFKRVMMLTELRSSLWSLTSVQRRGSGFKALFHSTDRRAGWITLHMSEAPNFDRNYPYDELSEYPCWLRGDRVPGSGAKQAERSSAS